MFDRFALLGFALGFAGCSDSGSRPATEAESQADAADQVADASEVPPDAWTDGPSRSGLRTATPIADLTPEERLQLCDWASVALGGEGHEEACLDCDGDACIDWTTTVNTNAECVAQLDGIGECGFVVGQYEQCVVDLAPDICTSAESCRALDHCVPD
jgi:hypothetical protein